MSPTHNVINDPPDFATGLSRLFNMCTQVDKKWACGHIGFFKIEFCENLFKSCKGTSATHEIVTDKEKCSDCERRDTLPEPLESK